MARSYLQILGTPAVLREQERYYGRSRPVTSAAERDLLGEIESDFIGERDSFFMATVGESGWPYLQHRGGPAGFLRVVDPSTLAFADYEGNHQMLSTGNIAVDDRVSLFLLDHANRRRLKILGHARVEDVHARPDLAEPFADPREDARIERLVFVDVVSFDWNCPQHITPRYTAAEVAAIVEPLRREIAELRARLSGRD